MYVRFRFSEQKDCLFVEVDSGVGEYADSDWDFISLEELAYALKPYLDKLKDE